MGTWRLAFLLGLLPWVGGSSVAAPLVFPAELPVASAAARAAMEVDRPVEREVLVPNGFEAWRTRKELILRYIAGPLKPIKLKVGAGRLIATTANLYIYPVGDRPPKRPSGSDMLLGYPAAGGMRRIIPGFDPGLKAGKPCVIEMEFCIVEVHEASGDHMIPGGGKDKVIWQKTFRQIFEEKARLPEKIRREMDGPPTGTMMGLPPAVLP